MTFDTSQEDIGIASTLRVQGSVASSHSIPEDGGNMFLRNFGFHVKSKNFLSLMSDNTYFEKRICCH
jgi:hypothetical protein